MICPQRYTVVQNINYNNRKETYSKTTEKKLNESYDTLKKLKTTVRKSEELQGPTKTKKITVKDFKKENNNKKEVLNNNNKFVIKPYEIKFPSYIFYKQPTSEQLHEVSEHFLKVKEYKKGTNKDYTPLEKTEHTRKKTFVYDFNGNVTKILGDYLLNIYRQQKFTFKLTIEFSFMRIKVEEVDKAIDVEFDLRLASTNTRPEGFKNPVVVDNKKDIDKLLFILVISLMLLGIFFAYSSTSSVASEKIYKTDYLLIAKHILFAFFSFLILTSLSLLEAKQIEKYCILGFIITSFLLLSVLIFGVEVKGSKRWINLIFFRFQPIEIYKPFFILLCSLIISNSKIGDLKLRIFFSFCVLFFSLLLLLNQPDVGQSLLIFSVWLILIFVSGISIVLLISLGSAIFIGIASVILLFSERFSYIFRRLKTFIDPNKGDNLQTQKALQYH